MRAQGSACAPASALLQLRSGPPGTRAKSLLTPVIISADSGYRIAAPQPRPRSCGRGLPDGGRRRSVTGARRPPAAARAGALTRAAARAASSTACTRARRRCSPQRCKTLAADVRVVAHGREANARSTVALMSLGVQHGDDRRGPRLRARCGRSARGARGALRAAAAREATAARRTADARRAAAPPARGVLARGRSPGSIASRGLAVGPARAPAPRRSSQVAESRAARARRRAPRSIGPAPRCAARLERRAARRRRRRRAAAREIAAAHLELLEDPELLAGARALIAQGKSAGFAWRAGDPRAGARAAARWLMRACASASMTCSISRRRCCCRWRAQQPAAAPQLPAAGDHHRARPAALAAARARGRTRSRACAWRRAVRPRTSRSWRPPWGSRRSWRSGRGSSTFPTGTALVLDADARLRRDRSGARRAWPQARAQLGTRRARERERAGARPSSECRTADGMRIEVLANVGSLAEAEAAVRNGAEGCGLLRTEFLFLERQTPPDEDEQTARLPAHRRRARGAAAHHPHARRRRRQADRLPAAAGGGESGAGLRGVRTSLATRSCCARQLRAILARASRRGRCRLLLPMITDVDGRAARCARCSRSCRRELGAPRTAQARRHDRDPGLGGARRRSSRRWPTSSRSAPTT